MRRREFIAVLGSAVAWPVVARAQQPDRVRRVGVLMSRAETDPEGQARLQTFRQSLADFGWVEGREVLQRLVLDADFFAGTSEFLQEPTELKVLPFDFRHVVKGREDAMAGPVIRHDRGRVDGQRPASGRLGLECDFVDGYESWVEKLAGMAPWDYLIGSVHYIAPGWDVDNPKYLARFKQYPVEEIWALYWKHYVRCIESGLFDFVAHPDLAKKFGYRPAGDLRRYYEPAVESLAEQNVAFEINTAGLRKEAEEIYPAPGFIELAKQAGVSMLINSDAHAPEEVAFGLGLARNLAHQAGYSKVCCFEKRQRIEVDL